LRDVWDLVLGGVGGLGPEKASQLVETVESTVKRVPLDAGEARCDVYVWTRSEFDVPANEVLGRPERDTRYRFSCTLKATPVGRRITKIRVDRSEEGESKTVDRVTVSSEALVDVSVPGRPTSVEDALERGLSGLAVDFDPEPGDAKPVVERLMRLLEKGPSMEVEGVGARTDWDGEFEYWVRWEGESVGLYVIRRVQTLSGRISLYGIAVEVPMDSLQRHEQ